MTGVFCVDSSRVVVIGDCDITRWDVLNKLISQEGVARYRSDIVTADGGVPVSDFDHQEEVCLKLIMSEVYVALHLLNRHGTLILKVFDIFTDQTIGVTNMLATLFENLVIYKPVSSRATNSEKYLVATNYRRPADLWKYTNYLCEVLHLSHPFERCPRMASNYTRNVTVANNTLACIQGQHILMCINNILKVAVDR